MSPKIDILLTLSNLSNPLLCNDFDRTLPSNFDTSPISRGLCDPPPARPRDDHDESDEPLPSDFSFLLSTS